MTTLPAPSRTTEVAVGDALAVLGRLADEFGLAYPEDTTAGGTRYALRKAQWGEPAGGNTEWTTSFYPGMLWLAGDLTGEGRWYDAARAHVASFVDRIRRKVHIDHHDLGFLYSLTCVPAWRHDGDTEARDAAVAAADHLLTRLLEPAGIIQAWGDLSDPEQQGRAIIDSLMNMPLLYWATEVTGQPHYGAAAKRHAERLAESIIRVDDTTHHTFYWDLVTGEPLRGATAQGHADDSTWARGQAWGIYGFALNHLHTGDPVFVAAAERCARRFLSLLPEDKVPFWDMVFTDGSTEPRDTSAGAIAVCGLVELARITGNDDYQRAADEILDSLATHYASPADGDATTVLPHSVYHRHIGLGVDEGSLWGDYFYMEALLRRVKPGWVSYWHPSA